MCCKQYIDIYTDECMFAQLWIQMCGVSYSELIYCYFVRMKSVLFILFTIRGLLWLNIYRVDETMNRLTVVFKDDFVLIIFQPIQVLFPI